MTYLPSYFYGTNLQVLLCVSRSMENRNTGNTATIYNATDADLRKIIFEHDRVIVKFIDAACPICEKLAPLFESLSRSDKYKSVLFLKMDAKENPVSSKEVKISGTPFIAIYKTGLLLNCGLVSDKQEIEDMLQQLL